jgi:hypothetical protein
MMSSSWMTAASWWEVVPSQREGATPLVHRCIRCLGWSEGFCLWVLREYKDFVTCKKFVTDYDAMQNLPSIPVDQMWCQHIIIDTKNYSKDCDILVGRLLLYYSADGAHDVDQDTFFQRIVRFTKRVLSLRTNVIELDPDVWNYEDRYAPQNLGTIDHSNRSSNNNNNNNNNKSINGNRNKQNSDLYDRMRRLLNRGNKDFLQDSSKSMRNLLEAISAKKTVLVGIHSKRLRTTSAVQYENVIRFVQVFSVVRSSHFIQTRLPSFLFQWRDN